MIMITVLDPEIFWYVQICGGAETLPEKAFKLVFAWSTDLKCRENQALALICLSVITQIYIRAIH